MTCSFFVIIGNNEVMSLWDKPDFNNRVQKTAVEALVGSMTGDVNVTVGDVPWK